MPDIWVGSASGRKRVTNPVVGTATGNRPISKIWVGTSGGNRLVFERWRLTTSMTATGTSQTDIRLDWTPSEGATYRLYRTGGPSTTGPLPNGPTALSYTDNGLTAGARYDYRLDILRGTEVVGSVLAFAATGSAPPPPSVQQKYVELEAVQSASYNGSGSNRGVAECYYGYYSGTNGRQKSLWRFDLPADVRNCAGIDRIDARIYNIHAFQTSGGTAGLVAHHGASLSGAFPGSTGILQYNGADWTPSLVRNGYLSQDGSGWLTNIQVLNAPGRPSLGEEFRAAGAYGLGLAAPNDSSSHYGYAAGASAASGQKPAIRIWYRA